MEEEEKGNEIILKTLKYYKKHDIEIHLEMKNGRFYNGQILEVAGDMLILKDRKLGAMPIMFIEINVLEKSIKEVKE